MGLLFSDERLRRMYSGGRADPAATGMARMWSRVFAWGLLPGRWVTLEVTGRRTGHPTRFPLGMADLDGEWYLVSMLGERCNWVRNVRAAGGRAVLVHGRRRPVLLVEVEASERARVLRRYLQVVPGGRPHIPVAPGAPVAAYESVAGDYPAFRVSSRPARDHAAPEDASRADGVRGRLVWFFVLAYLLAWLWLLPITVTGGRVTAGQGWPTHFPALVAPLVAAVVVTARYDGAPGLADLGRRMVRVRAPLRWWVFAVSPLVVLVLVLLVERVLGQALPAAGDFARFSGLPSSWGAVGVGAVIVVVGGLGEETGWRGYALPQLRRRHTPLAATLLLAALWAGWHLPMFFVVEGFREFTAPVTVGWVLGLFCGAVVLTWLYDHPAASCSSRSGTAPTTSSPGPAPPRDSWRPSRRRWSSCWRSRSSSSTCGRPEPAVHRSSSSSSRGLGRHRPVGQRPTAWAAVSAVCHRRRSAPGAQVEWVPLEMRSGSRSRQTGPSATRAASKTTA